MDIWLENCEFIFVKKGNLLYLNVMGEYFIQLPIEMIKFATNLKIVEDSLI